MKIQHNNIHQEKDKHKWGFRQGKVKCLKRCKIEVKKDLNQPWGRSYRMVPEICFNLRLKSLVDFNC